MMYRGQNQYYKTTINGEIEKNGVFSIVKAVFMA